MTEPVTMELGIVMNFANTPPKQKQLCVTF